MDINCVVYYNLDHVYGPGALFTIVPDLIILAPIKVYVISEKSICLDLILASGAFCPSITSILVSPKSWSL